MQQPALLDIGGRGEYEYAMLETLLMQGRSASVGAPRFNGTDYESWQFSMKLHLRVFHPRVWSIVETGLSCVDEADPTALELRNIHYNAQAMNAIYCALSDDQLYRIWHLDTAKEVWDALQVIHEDTPIVRELKVEQLREKMKLFAWRKGELPIAMYSRLTILATEMKRLGCQEVTDSYVVRKMLRAMTSRNSTFEFEAIIRQRPDFEELTPLDVLHNFQIYDNMQELSRRSMRGYARAKVDTVTRSEPARDAGCSGEAPHFDGTHYLSWQRRMKFHLLSIHPRVWRAVETGFSCVDGANAMALEESNLQQNAGAICAMDDDPYNWIRPYRSAKQIWDDLRKFNEAVGKSKLSSLRTDMDWFVLGENESPSGMYTRLNNLANEMKGLGCKEITDSYLVRKMLRAMTPRNPNLVFLIREKPKFELLTPRDVLATFLLYEMEQKESKLSSGYALPRSSKKVNAALKPKQVQVEESSDDEKDHDQDQEQIQHRMKEMSLLGKNYGGVLGKKGYETRSNFSDKSKMRKSKRYCYQCGHPNHFIADCPWKEDRKEEKEKSKYKRKPLDHKGKPYKPDGQKGVEAHPRVNTGVESGCRGGRLRPLRSPVNGEPENSSSADVALRRGLVPKPTRKPAAQPSQQPFCLSAHLPRGVPFGLSSHLPRGVIVYDDDEVTES